MIPSMSDVESHQLSKSITIDAVCLYSWLVDNDPIREISIEAHVRNIYNMFRQLSQINLSLKRKQVVGDSKYPVWLSIME